MGFAAIERHGGASTLIAFCGAALFLVLGASPAAAGDDAAGEQAQAVAEDAAPTVDADFEFGAVLPEHRVTLSGVATDDHGVVRILVGVKDRDRRRWLQDDLNSWGPANMFVAELATPGGIATAWSVEVGLLSGNYALAVRALDTGGSHGDLVPYRHFSVAAENAGPYIDARFEFGDVLRGRGVSLEGSAFDDDGVVAVSIAIKDRARDLWLQSNWSSWGPFQMFGVPMSDAATSVAWWEVVPLDPGDYSLAVRAVDSLGNHGDLVPYRHFSVAYGPDGTHVEANVWDDLLEGPEVHLDGYAADDDDVIASVYVGIKDRNRDRWLQDDLTGWGPFNMFPAELRDPSSQETGWWIDLLLEPGDYSLAVRAFDGLGNHGDMKPYAPFTVARDATGPDVEVDFEYWDVLGGPRVTLSGVARDDKSAIAAVDVGVKHLGRGMWLQDDLSSWGYDNMFPAALSDPNQASTAWSVVVSLEPGDYSLAVRAFDAAGNFGEIAPYHRFIVAPDEAAIEVEFGFGSVLAGPRLMLRGGVQDGQLVELVGLGVKDRSRDLWLQDDLVGWGSFNLFPAELTNPGGAHTWWSAVVELDEGDYALAVRVFDGDGGHSDLAPYRHFSVTADFPSVDADFDFGHQFVGRSVHLAGSAIDDASVTDVQVGIKDRGRDLWLEDDMTSWGGFNMFPAYFYHPGSSRVEWGVSLDLDLGQYSMAVRAIDDFGNHGDLVPYRHFSVAADVTGPIIEVDLEPGAELVKPIWLSGTATDETSVTHVRLAVRDRVTKLWLQSDKVSWSSTYRGFDAITRQPGGPVVDWLFEIALPEGRYSLAVQARDTYGNWGELVPYLPFSVVPADTPDWQVLVLVYQHTDFEFAEDGVDTHFVAQMTAAEMARAGEVATAFFEIDVPELSSGLQTPQVTFRYPSRALDLSSYCGYWPAPGNVAPEADPAFDSIVVIWDGSGTDVLSGRPLTVANCRGIAAYRGSEPAHMAVPIDWVLTNDRNVFKHEWGHSILFYYAAAGTAPTPAVDNHISDQNPYVHCGSGEPYVFVEELVDSPIPNSIYNNQCGFTHDYYSGLAARPWNVYDCLGISAAAWASGGPVTRS